MQASLFSENLTILSPGEQGEVAMDYETKPDDSGVDDLFESLGIGEEPGVPGFRPNAQNLDPRTPDQPDAGRGASGRFWPAH